MHAVHDRSQNTWLRLVRHVPTSAVIAIGSLLLLTIGAHPGYVDQLGDTWLILGVLGLVCAVGLAEAHRRHDQQQAARIAACLTEAQTDPLTGCGNRRLFEERLRAALRSQVRQPVSVLFVDFDLMQQINERFGHQAGDAVLAGSVPRLLSALGQRAVVGRYGGEEFGVLLEQTSLTEAARLGERVRHELSKAPFEYRGQEIHVTVSVGVAQGAPLERSEQVIGRADACVFAAKSAGRDCVYVHDGTACIDETSFVQPDSISGRNIPRTTSANAT
jgi:diguanylate cyclase (GGDEF)-like protein